MTFTVMPESNVGISDVIKNQAAIYFDFNEPIITNEVEQMVITGVAEPVLNKNVLRVYPNPTTNQLNINLPTSQNATAIGMMDMLGREVLRQPFATQLDVSHLPAGNYMLAVYTPDGVLRERVSVVR